jgi:hypothetical protein
VRVTFECVVKFDNIGIGRSLEGVKGRVCRGGVRPQGCAMLASEGLAIGFGSGFVKGDEETMGDEAAVVGRYGTVGRLEDEGWGGVLLAGEVACLFCEGLAAFGFGGETVELPAALVVLEVEGVAAEAVGDGLALLLNYDGDGGIRGGLGIGLGEGWRRG